MSMRFSIFTKTLAVVLIIAVCVVPISGVRGTV